jgi:DNA-binding NarL/FixJ family response regulator
MKQPSTKPIRVILADDHPIVRAGICDALKEIPGVEVVGEANDGRAAIELVKSAQPDIVFMDISMPGLNGLEATERIVKAFPQTRVIILSRTKMRSIIGAPSKWVRRATCSRMRPSRN